VELAIELVPVLEKMGHKQESDQLFSANLKPYEELAASHPQSAYMHNSYAWLAANCRRELDKALEHAQEAVKLEPKADGYIDTLAEVHFRRGEKEKAIEFMKQCLALKPRNAYYRKQLERFQKGDIMSDVPPLGEDDE
jgi:tetratricopeptide (TPR) repeat protein